MHSHKNLAVLALIASAVSPALAAPIRESQNEARGIINPELLKTLGMEFAMGFVPSAAMGYMSKSQTPAGTTAGTTTGTTAGTPHSRQVTEAFKGRSIAERSPEPGFGRGGLLMFGLSMISSLAGTSMGSSVGSHMRRDVSPAEMGAVLTELSKRAEYTPEEALSLRLVGRALNELD